MYTNGMNYTKKLNSEMIRSFLDREFRKKEYLAVKLGVSTDLIKKMIYQGHIPKERTLGKLANLLGVRTQDLLERHVEGAV